MYTVLHVEWLFLITIMIMMTMMILIVKHSPIQSP